jgi:tRNA pseudouridine55 synthase
VQGILPIDKPKGWTSFDVVNYVRKIVANDLGVKPKNVKVGHIGTLDPLATGLLVLLIGKEYTQKAISMSKSDKVYEVEAVLGKVSASFDTETDQQNHSDYQPTSEEVTQALSSYIGRIMQVPPVYSAIKVDGKRAYRLARSGQEVSIPPREVEIYNIFDIKYQYPKLKFSCKVSSGTYIRTLVNDLGLKLTSGAYMSELKRLSIDQFLLSSATEVKDLNIEQIKKHLIE